MPDSITYGPTSTISRYNLLFSLLVFTLIPFPTVKSSSYSSDSGDVNQLDAQIQIPDHQGYVKKLYYYRLPISSTKLGQIKHLTIKEVDKDSLPQWLLLRKEKDRWELIGFPQEQDKGIHFLQIEIANKDDTKLADVFTLEITNIIPSYQTSSSSSSTSSPSTLSSSSSSAIGNKGNCIIRVITKFDSLLDVWKTISYLIPSKLKQEIELSAKLIEYTSSLEEIDDPNILMNQWSQHHFVITQVNDKDDFRQFQLTIENQECSIDKIKSSSDGFYWKLKKLGLEFHHIQIMTPPSSLDGKMFDEDDDSDSDDYSDGPSNGPVDGVKPSKAYSKSFVPVSLSNDNFAPRKRHGRRNVPHVGFTPTQLPDIATITSTLTDDYLIDPSTMSREVPTLTSPSAFPSSSVYPGLPVFTPPMPDINENVISGGEFTFHPKLYTTPTPTMEPPSVYEGLSTPTPILPSVKLSDLPPSSLLIPDINTIDSVSLIAPTPTFGISEVSKNQIEETPAGKDKVHPGEPIDPAILSNSRPELRARIPKLAPIAGKYYIFKIPSNTFIDREDGMTDKLRLGFHRVTSSAKGQPTKDFWIQFDAENQEIHAFPTDDDVGIYENQFYLEAVDSGGLSSYENITIHVRQHTSYRKFPYNITFYRVYWDPLRITTTIEALRNFAQIISQVNGDSNIDSFIVQHLIKEVIDGKDYWTIVATNDSIPAYPCPTKKIQQLYTRLADKQSKGQYALPSEFLTSKMNKMFRIEGVGLSIGCSKPNTAAEKPVLRNAIDSLKFRLGEVFRYKIAENMFYSGRGRNTYNLELSLYDYHGRIPPPDGFVKFNEKTFEIIGLADDRKYVRENEFNLVARDRESENEASDAFVITIEDPWNEEETSFTVSIGLSLNDKMDIDDKLDIANRVATKIFNDSDTSSLRILKIVNRKYTLMQSGYYTGTETAKNPNLSDADDDENVIERRKRSEFYDNSIDEGSIHSMYEYVWTNKSEPLLAKGGECPSTVIQEHILQKLFQPESNFATWDEKFADKYRVLSIEFKPVGKCSNYMTAREMYRDNMKPIIIPEKDVKSQPDDNVQYGQPASKDYEVHANELDDYYLRTIIPAIGTVAVLLVVLCVIVCILVKCRRDIDKNRFDMTIRPGIDGYPTEVDAFIQKGRRPVILQSDYQQHLPMNSMMVTYNPVRQQTYSMANVNKNSYHALAHAVEQQRRQPPPYR